MKAGEGCGNDGREEARGKLLAEVTGEDLRLWFSTVSLSPWKARPELQTSYFRPQLFGLGACGAGTIRERLTHAT